MYITLRVQTQSQIARDYCRIQAPNVTPVRACFLDVSYLNLQVGADAVGMSTAHEVIVAAHCGMKSLGISLITNAVNLSYEAPNDVSHEEVLEVGKKRSKDVENLVKCVIEKLN